MSARKLRTECGTGGRISSVSAASSAASASLSTAKPTPNTTAESSPPSPTSEARPPRPMSYGVAKLLRTPSKGPRPQGYVPQGDLTRAEAGSGYETSVARSDNVRTRIAPSSEATQDQLRLAGMGKSLGKSFRLNREPRPSEKRLRRVSAKSISTSTPGGGSYLTHDRLLIEWRDVEEDLARLRRRLYGEANDGVRRRVARAATAQT
jgi:hypothetical protein